MALSVTLKNEKKLREVMRPFRPQGLFQLVADAVCRDPDMLQAIREFCKDAELSKKKNDTTESMHGATCPYRGGPCPIETGRIQCESCDYFGAGVRAPQ